jgi:glycosyltransferase involved in cell wall biosynthesis
MNDERDYEKLRLQFDAVVKQLEEKEAIISELAKALAFYRATFTCLRYPLRVLSLAKTGTRWMMRLLLRRIYPRLGRLYQHRPQPIYLASRYRERLPLLHTPRVSIVTPSFQQGKYIRRTIDSVLGQHYPHLEYFVQDGGSTDETVDILRSFQDQLSGWESKPDQGQSHAINLGFSHCTGEIMAWINSDDVLLPGAIHAVVEYFNRHPEIDVVYGDRLLIDENDLQIGRWILPGHDSNVLSWADYIPQETLFWRRKIWDRIGGRIDQDFKFAMDWDLLVRFREAGARFGHMRRFVGAFRVHKHQKTCTAIDDIGFQEMSLIRARLFGRVPSHHEIRRAVFPFLLKHLYADYTYEMRRVFQRDRLKLDVAGVPLPAASDR